MIRRGANLIMKTGADVVVRHGYFVVGGRPAGADRPHGFVGDDRRDAGECPFCRGQRTVELAGQNVEGLAGVALSFGFADTYDGDEVCAERGGYFGLDHAVGLAQTVAAFGMTQNNVGGPGVGQHSGADLAGEGAAGLGVAVLATDGHRSIAKLCGDDRQNRRRRADQQIAVGGRGGGRIVANSGRQRSARRRQIVHFPVAGD